MMKRMLLVLGVFGVSTLLFAHGYNRGVPDRGRRYHSGYTVGFHYVNDNLSGAEYKKLTLIGDRHFRKNERLLIQINAKDFEIDRFIIRTKVDRLKTGRPNANRYRHRKKFENKNLKHRQKLRREFGDRHYYRNGNRRYYMMDGYDRYHIRRY